MRIKRAAIPTPDPDYFWRSLKFEEWEILTQRPSDYGLYKDELKELAQARRLKDERCVQVSQHEAESRIWLRSGAVALIRIPRKKLSADDWEFESGQPFPVVKAQAVVAHFEVVMPPPKSAVDEGA